MTKRSLILKLVSKTSSFLIIFLKFYKMPIFVYNLFKFGLLVFTEVLSSDEDEIDEVGNEYLEKLQERVNKKANNNAFSVNAQLQVLKFTLLSFSPKTEVSWL